MTLLPIPYIYSLMSTPPTPATLTSHNSPTNASVDLTAAFISLVHQMIQTKATLMPHLQTCYYLQLLQHTTIAQEHKLHSLPFTKWYGTSHNTPLFFAQVATYKSEAFYSGVQDWTRTTPENKQLSIKIGANILAPLPRSVSSLFLNDIRFDSDGIAMFSHLLTHLNPSSSENPILTISDLTCLEMGLGESGINYMSRVCSISQCM